MADTDYKIGTAYGNMVAIPTLTGTVCHSVFFPWAKTYWKSTGLTYGDGYKSCTWTFDYLPPAGVIALRAYCASVSAAVYIQTRTDIATFVAYTANMHWPQDAHEKRTRNGGYVNLEIEFTHLEVYTP